MEKARVRLMVECDLEPILNIEVADGDDISDEAAAILRQRYAERIATAVANVLKEDVDVRWHNKEFNVTIAFYKPVTDPYLPVVNSLEDVKQNMKNLKNLK